MFSDFDKLCRSVLLRLSTQPCQLFSLSHLTAKTKTIRAAQTCYSLIMTASFRVAVFDCATVCAGQDIGKRDVMLSDP